MTIDNAPFSSSSSFSSAHDKFSKRARSHSTSSTLSGSSTASVAVEGRSQPVASKRKVPARREQERERDAATPPSALEPLTSHRLQVRQKQIDYGKNTLGYDAFCKQVPKGKRAVADPVTPDMHQRCSRRSWDGQIKRWRRLLHQYDPTQEDPNRPSRALNKPKSPALVLSTEQATVERDLMQSILGQEFDDDNDGTTPGEDAFEREVAALMVQSGATNVAVGVDDEFLESFFDKS